MRLFYAAFTRREEDSRRRSNFPFALHAEISVGVASYVEKEKKTNCRPLAVERPAAANLFYFLYLASNSTFRAKEVYMVLGFSARKILARKNLAL